MLWYGRMNMLQMRRGKQSQILQREKESCSLTDVYKRLQQVAKQLLGTSQFSFV